MDTDTIREEIENEGLDTYLQTRFEEVVKEAGQALYGPKFKADEVMNRHLPIVLAQEAASTIRLWERTAQPA